MTRLLRFILRQNHFTDDRFPKWPLVARQLQSRASRATWDCFVIAFQTGAEFESVSFQIPPLFSCGFFERMAQHICIRCCIFAYINDIYSKHFTEISQLTGVAQEVVNLGYWKAFSGRWSYDIAFLKLNWCNFMNKAIIIIYVIY